MLVTDDELLEGRDLLEVARAAERGEPPFVLVLDSLQDPHNVGSLLRSAEAAGVHGVVFPSTRQAPLSPSAVKASAAVSARRVVVATESVDEIVPARDALQAAGYEVEGVHWTASRLLDSGFAPAVPVTVLWGNKK